LDSVQSFSNGVPIIVLSSVIDNDGDIDSDNDCNILLDSRTLTDEPTLFELFNEHDENQIISLFKSHIAACFVSSFFERIH